MGPTGSDCRQPDGVQPVAHHHLGDPRAGDDAGGGGQLPGRGAPDLAARQVHLDRGELERRLNAYFENDSMPVMVALLRMAGPHALEVDRGFIVPDGWRERAGERVRAAPR